MTNKEKETAFAMRIRGATYTEISKKIGYTPQAIREMMIGAVRINYTFRLPVIYPAISQYIVEHCDGRISTFAEACGVKECSVRSFLAGRTSGKAKTRQSILDYTGLDPETAFAREDEP